MSSSKALERNSLRRSATKGVDNRKRVLFYHGQLATMMRGWCGMVNSFVEIGKMGGWLER